MSESLTFAMVAGEASGDLLGAALVREIKRHHPDARCYGIGGPKMIAEGFESLFPMERLSVMGLVEVLGRLRELLGIRKRLRDTFLADQPDVFIGIDAPDFNLALERQLKSGGIPTVHYVSPQVWAWREGRLKKIRRSVDHMLCLLPFEADYYQGHGVPVTFVGHPLADQVAMEPDQKAARQSLQMAEDGPVMAILPGSRKAEVARLAELFLDTAREVRKKIPSIRFLIPAANDRRKQQLLPILEACPDLDIVLTDGRASEVMAASDAILIASGTASLEAALHKRPMVISYRMARLSFAILSRLVKVKHVGLPNLLSDRPMVPELLQDQATVENLTSAMLKALQDECWRQDVTSNFAHIHQTLKRDASVLAWQAIQSVIGKTE
ncbi:lipid-A-disaccharide synthase [Endozoicomonas montiporae]|uniref:Lipid-A-disaccharide synthase n=2 Tax=Endozoicomonas montiporae TaxID=1027273 RepID=A0A081NBN7_9GAMM|nr:lipid-A-disaccharide synthase [Endozoicomonas montiporae]AMO56155.1 lipid-A-disaccharide synthase [Endozoicomonas montiporae CL-33]KEQ15860.1 lipid-A-disaccharide synthase [Endozoicomonas montiporae]